MRFTGAVAWSLWVLCLRIVSHSVHSEGFTVCPRVPELQEHDFLPVYKQGDTYYRCSEAQSNVAGRGSRDRLGKAVQDRRAQRAPTLAETQIREERSENSQRSEILKNISDDHHHVFLVELCGLWRANSAPGKAHLCLLKWT